MGALSLLRVIAAIALTAPLAAVQGYDFPSPWNSSNAPDVVPYPPPDVVNASIDTTPVPRGFVNPKSKRGAGNFYLRVMSLGASISQGYRSSDGNGYRKYLREQLRYAGWQVNMVGSQAVGTMKDNQNEGHPGWRIEQVTDAFLASASMVPNLVVINVGTNDCLQNYDTDNAGARLKTMIDAIYAAIPTTTIIVSTLVPSGSAETCIEDLNTQYRDLVASYWGKRIALADMHAFLSLSDIHPDDGTHPTDFGYKKMASVWWDAISWAEDMIQPPGSQIDDANDTTAPTCAKVAGTAPEKVQIQRGSGTDDGNYKHSSTGHGALLKEPASSNNSYYFAQLVNAGGAPRESATDEAIRVTLKSGSATTYAYKLNLNGGFAGDWIPFTVNMDCSGEVEHHFADLNNDGLGPTGEVSAAVNQGGSPPTFHAIGQIKPSPGNYVAKDGFVADIDGDGRADYCVIEEWGDIRCWRNGGTYDTVSYWQGFASGDDTGDVVFTAKGKGNKYAVRLADLNGDFRADWMWIGDKGDIDTYINQRWWQSGIVPNWVHAGITHGGMNVAGAWGNITFGRIFGSGRLDYIYKKQVGSNFEFHVWENQGSGGTRMKGDGVYYCDMTGDGSDDYVWVEHDGSAASFFGNIHNPPYWNVGTTELFNIQRSRRSIHIADWDGDGRCDVLSQRKSDGALEMWKNNYDSNTGEFSFTYEGFVTGAATCSQGWGVNIFDKGLQLADIDGDGRADYLCLEPDGRVTGWLNKASGLVNQNQIKFSEGHDRANLHFADVEHSGRADLLWVDKYSGAVTVYKNSGPTPASGSSFTWFNRGILYSGNDRGNNIHFANLGGVGRADMIDVLPLTNRAWVYWNICPGSGGGDDGPVVSPDLLPYSASHNSSSGDTGSGDGGSGSGDGGSGSGDGGSGSGGDGGSSGGGSSGGSGSSTCTTSDNTFSSSVVVKAGTYRSTTLLDHSSDPIGLIQYVTIVNLTPYLFKFRKDISHSYQMKTFDFDDVPPGHSRQCTMDYDAGSHNPVDTKGEAYFDVVGDGVSGKTFAILGRTHIPDTYPRRTVVDLSGWGMGAREFEDPDTEVPVTFIITGSEAYGYHTNLNQGPVGWMQNLKPVIEGRKLKHVAMPGSHDSGMSTIRGGLGGVEGNTQTQRFGIYNQLSVGARYFDLRVGYHIFDEKFVTAHLGSEYSKNILGALGVDLSEVVNDLNRFTTENPGEVIVVYMRYFSYVDAVLNGTRRDTDRRWTKDTMLKFWGEFASINNRCPNLDTTTQFQDRPIGDFMAMNGNKGCVLFMADLNITGFDLTPFNADLGIYSKNDNMPRNDPWADKSEPDVIDNFVKAQAPQYAVRDASDKDTFFVAQWVATPNVIAGALFAGISDYAIFSQNPTVYWDGMPWMNPGLYPSVIMQDYIGVYKYLGDTKSLSDATAELKIFCMGLNLYMASENCGVSTIPNPLVHGISGLTKRDDTTDGDDTSSSESSTPVGGDQFTGIVFANGTVLESWPEGFDYWDAPVLLNGTIFANGTELEEPVLFDKYTWTFTPVGWDYINGDE